MYLLLQKDPSNWGVVEPLPSYGRGIDLPGKRYKSLISGHMLHDVIITGNNNNALCIRPFDLIMLVYSLYDYSFLGDNGTIDGQGLVWWDRFTSHSLKYNRPHLVEFISSQDITISNVTFLNAPCYTVHAIYSRYELA